MGESADGDRWRARPLVAAVVVVAVFVIPVGCSIAAAAVMGHLWAPASTAGGTAWRWVVILGASTVVFIGCERLTRKMLPLTVLLKMGMVFPGRAPKRLSVALRSWTTRDLSRRIEEARRQGITDEPTVAAEQIVALAATLNAHDRKTRGHAERVRAYTDLIAEELRLPDGDRDRLRWSALLHDVGKLTVHSDVLNKAGALSDDEWELMRQHPLEGAKLTAPLAAWLGPWANTIAEHHERFDGAGYPVGLAGHEISLGGRIVAVADSYDTMTSVRSYHKPMPAEAARAELAACAGAQFDPVVVRAFLAVSVSRLHAVAPLTWIGSLPFSNLGPQLAQIASVGGRIGITGVAASAGVVALVAGHPAAVTTGRGHLSAGHGAVGSAAGGASSPAADRSPGGTGPGRVAGGDAGGSASTGRGTGTTVAGGRTGSRPTGTGDGDGQSTGAQSPGAATDGAQPSGSGNTGGGAGAGTGGDAGPTTTVATGGSVPTIPTTTVGGTPPPATTTTTSPAPPPLVAPSSLKATSECAGVIIEPQVTLTWTASPTARVTGYTILRSAKQTSGYTAIGSVSGRTTVKYTDTTANGLSTTYWYEVEATAGGSSPATSSPVSVTTPLLCL